MTGIGVFFILFGLVLSAGLALYLKSFVYLAMFVTHLAAAFFMWNFTLTRVADSWSYYTFSGSLSDFEVGTWFIAWFAGSLREVLGASYVDTYTVFHLFGYGGVALFYHLCHQAFLTSGLPKSAMGPLVTGAAFLPSLHIWTSVVGKDSTMFLGTMCFVWGSLRPRARAWSLVLGVALCFLVRPHVAALMVVSCALAVAVDQRVPVAWRGVLVATLVIGLAGASPFIMEYVGLTSTDSDTLGTYIEGRQAANLVGGSSVDISQYSFPVQFFTYMYRPLFFDAAGGMALVVSLESLFYLILTALFGGGVWRVFRTGQHGFFFSFNALFWLLATSLFATTTSNLGISMRQKTAFLPSFFLVLLTVYAVRLRSRATAVQPVGGLSAAVSPLATLRPGHR